MRPGLLSTQNHGTGCKGLRTVIHTPFFVRCLGSLRAKHLQQSRSLEGPVEGDQRTESNNVGFKSGEQHAFCRRTALAALASMPIGSLCEPSSAMVVDDVTSRYVYDAVNESVVAIAGEGPGIGICATGVVWDKRGHIVTNLHVVQRFTAGKPNPMIRVTIPGKGDFSAILQAKDAYNDIAVVRLDDPPEDLTPVALGQSKDLKVGQSVYALGNPYAKKPTMSAGVVSGLERSMRSPTSYISGVVQTDATINATNSGGPLVDSFAHMVGLSTASFVYKDSQGRGSGVNFAVPTDALLRIVPNLIIYGNASGKM